MLLPKLLLVAVLVGSFVSVLMLVLVTPRQTPEDWRGLVDSVGILFRWVIVPASFLAVVFSLMLLWRERRWFLRQRWAQLKLALLVAALPALHLGARNVFAALRQGLEPGAPEDPSRLLSVFTLLVAATIAVLFVALWLARFKPRVGQRSVIARERSEAFDRATGGTTTLVSAQPALPVQDIERAFAFYARLGFVKHYQNRDVHLLVERDGVILHLATQLIEGVGGCQVMVRGVEDLYARCRAADLRVVHELCHEPWGNRDFTVADPDGNLLTFAEPEARADRDEP